MMLDADDYVGCLIEGHGMHWCVVFPRGAEPEKKEIRVEIPAIGPCRLLFCCLQPGTWTAGQADDTSAKTFSVTKELRAAWLEGSGGVWTLEKK